MSDLKIDKIQLPENVSIKSKLNDPFTAVVKN